MCNGTYTSWDKKCEHKKIEYLRRETVKQSTPWLYNISSNPFYQKEEPLGEMRPSAKPQQKLPLENKRSQQYLFQKTLIQGKKRKSTSNGQPPL